jgi:ankyrin repeat protein
MLLDSLRFNQLDHHTNIKDPHPKTCEWLFGKYEYRDWLSTDIGVLWIKGRAGAGKSTLMKFALAHARKIMKDSVIASFFFNARGEELEKSTAGMYRSLLTQLLDSVQEIVFDRLGSMTLNKPVWSVEALEELFNHAIQKLGRRPLTCIIDALDECHEDQVRQVVALFEGHVKRAQSSGCRFRVLFSSRPYPYIGIEKGLCINLESEKGHNQDIAIYLHRELRIGRSKLAEQIRTQLLEKASGIFLWVCLVAHILNTSTERECSQISELQRRIQGIPTDLHELFEDIVMGDSQNKELILGIQWVLFAKRPLKPEELYFAILSGLRPEALTPWNHEEITVEYMERRILNSSNGLAELTISTTPTVQFIHTSVRDFLLQENGTVQLCSARDSDFTAQSHELLKQCCFNYIKFAISEHVTSSASLPTASSPDADKFPFLEYAVRNVLYHSDAAQGRGVQQSTFIQSFPFVDWITLDNHFIKDRMSCRKADAPLSLPTEQNLAYLIRLLYRASHLDIREKPYGVPFLTALIHDDELEVETLTLDANQQLNDGKPQECSTPLKLAGRIHDQYGRDIRLRKDQSILSHVAEHGDVSLASLLLATGNFELESKDNSGRTLLSRAAEEGHEAVVKLLLEKGADPNAKDKASRTPLWWAVWAGHEAVAKLLLERAADSNARDEDGRTPLWWAVWAGHEAVVKLLLEKAADPNEDGQLARCCAGVGHEAVVKLLLEKAANPNAIDKEGRTLLSWAAEKGHETIVKLLLEKAADPNAKDKDGRTPLSWAAEKGHEIIVKLLLEKAADPRAKDKDGRTPMWWATDNAHKTTVRLLTSTGRVNTNAGGRDELRSFWENIEPPILPLEAEIDEYTASGFHFPMQPFPTQPQTDQLLDDPFFGYPEDCFPQENVGSHSIELGSSTRSSVQSWPSQNGVLSLNFGASVLSKSIDDDPPPTSAQQSRPAPKSEQGYRCQHCSRGFRLLCDLRYSHLHLCTGDIKDSLVAESTKKYMNPDGSDAKNVAGSSLNKKIFDDMRRHIVPAIPYNAHCAVRRSRGKII